MRAAKKITIITLKQPEKLPDDFVPRHLSIVTSAISQIFSLALEVAMSSAEPTNGIVAAQSAKFCRAVVCGDVASSAERLVVNNAAPQLWAMLRATSNEHAGKFRDAILPRSASAQQQQQQQQQEDEKSKGNATNDDDNDDDALSECASSLSSAAEDIDALRNVSRLWISWSGAVYFIQHLLSWMEKSDNSSASSAFDGSGCAVASSSSSIRGTCFAALSRKLIEQRPLHPHSGGGAAAAGAAAGTTALNAAVRGFILCLRAIRDGEDQVPGGGAVRAAGFQQLDGFGSNIPVLEMANLKNVMLQCDCYGDETSSSFIVENNSSNQKQKPQQKVSLALPSSVSSRPLLLLPAYLNETKAYYSREAAELLTATGTSSGSSGVIAGGTGALCEHYALRVHRRLNEERLRAQQFLAAFSRPLADAVLQQALVAPPFDEVIDRDFSAALARASSSGLSPNTFGENNGSFGGMDRALSSSGNLMTRMMSGDSGTSNTMMHRAMSTGSLGSASYLPFASVELAVLHRIYVFATLPHVGGDKVEKLRTAFKQFVAAEATMIVSNAQGAAQEAQMVPLLLQLYAKCEAIVTTCFRADEDFRLKFRESIQKALRLRQTKVAELVAKQFDVLLRDGDKQQQQPSATTTAVGPANGGGGSPPAGGCGGGVTGGGDSVSGGAATADTTLTALDRLCRFAKLVPAKDIFETFYMSNMAKRLLHFRTTYGGASSSGSSAVAAAAAQNEDLEHTTISRLKHVCGPTIATRCTGMMKDMELSRDFVAAAADKMLERDPAGLLDPLVLTQGYWPVAPEVRVPMPAELRRLTSYFSELYAAEFKRRKLVWSPLMSAAVVRAQFYPKGERGPVVKKELTVSYLQSQILLALSGRAEAVSEEELRGVFRMKPEDEEPITAETSAAEQHNKAPSASSAAEVEKALGEGLQCAIYSLINAKLILASERKDSVTSITKMFESNRAFAHRMTKIRVAQVQLRAAEESQQQAQSTIAQRAHTVDAGIARIMKARKRIAHWDLVTQTLELTKLPLDPADIKKRIESLIDKHFMQRDPDDPSTYIFIA